MITNTELHFERLSLLTSYYEVSKKTEPQVLYLCVCVYVCLSLSLTSSVFLWYTRIYLKDILTYLFLSLSLHSLMFVNKVISYFAILITH